MLRKISLSLFCIAVSLSPNLYSTQIPNLQRQNITIEYELVANTPLILMNYMFWEVEAECRVTTEDQSNEFFVVALAKKGRVNGITVSAGESLRIEVHQGENLRLSADSGAKVEITNFGQHPVKVTCTA